MKLWIKYLIAAVLGIACALILPVSNSSVAEAIRFITEILLS